MHALSCVQPPHTCRPGVRDPKLRAIGRAGPTSKRKGFRNICRNFHSYLAREKKFLQVKISMIRVRVRVHRPKVREIVAEYPYIALQSWARYLLSHAAKYLLGGFSLSQKQEWGCMFQRFWQRYKMLDPGHPVFRDFSDYTRLIPYCIHGDEGRGKAKNPIHIVTYQPLVGVCGEDRTNITGYLWPCWQPFLGLHCL